MKTKIMELRRRLADIRQKAAAINDAADAEDRELTEEETELWDSLMEQAQQTRTQVGRLEQLDELPEATKPEPEARNEQRPERRAPAHNRIGRGDTEARALAHFVRSGDYGGLREIRASNDTDMNVGTDADGGYAVPTGHYNGIIARRDEGMLARRLGVMDIPGVGTTINVPNDDEADGEFVSTAEGSDHDRDAPALNEKAMTLVRYTKKIQLSWELLEDEDSRLLAFLENFVGRGMAKTHNNLLLTEVAANGTSLKTFASATVIAVGELEDIVGNDDLDPYLDDMNSVGWVMKNSVLWEIKALASSSIPYYGDIQGLGDGPNILGYPVLRSAKSGATAASAKSVYFGNWSLVGLREGGMMSFLRDPYSYEAGIELRYQFRAVYGVLQAEAIGYGVHPSA